tara:strand:+ start:592 stop:1086 length:495 start_codon:yes stop_codon:yes gene_type:complete
MKSIALIGMAGCGKSTLGKAAALELDLSFVDTDKLIEKEYSASLEKIKKSKGYKFIRKAEERAILQLNPNINIIATGGSAVYSNKSIKHLSKFAKIIYIEAPLEIIIERIKQEDERGLAVPDGMSIPEIYIERKPLYEKYSEIILDGSKSIPSLIADISDIIHE